MPKAAAPHLAIDLRAAFGSNARRGIGRYTLGLGRAINDLEVAATFLVPPEYVSTDRATEIGLPLVPTSRGIIRQLRDRGPVVFHSGSLFEMPVNAPVIPASVSRDGCAVAATLYDAIPYAEPERYQATDPMRRFYDLRAVLVRSCDRLLAISAHAATSAVDLLRLDPRRVTTIGTGVDAPFSPATDRLTDERIAHAAVGGLHRPFVVCVAGNDLRKNADALIRGFALLPIEVRQAHQLVIVGALSPELTADWRDVARSAGCADEEVLFTGDIDDEVLIALYRTARLSAFPSLNEGFGLPVAEAAACGCPTITSDRTSVPEVLDFPDSTFDPIDVQAIARSLHTGLTDDRFRDQLHTAGRRAAARWTWTAVAERAVEALLSVPTRPTSRTTQKPHIALVGPFGGSPSGIGAYNERLLPHLDALADVTCFVEKFSGEAPLGTDGRRFPAGVLGARIDPSDFDHVIYAIGNSPFHLTSVLQLVDRAPGHLWFHEAQLAELHVGVAHLLKNQPWGERHLTRLIAAEAGPEMVTQIRGKVGWEAMLDIATYHRLGVRLLRETVATAQSVIVSSEVAAMIIRDAPIDFDGSLLTLPLAFPAADRRYPTNTRPDVAVLGWLSTTKGIDRAVTLLSQLRASTNARLVFIGKANDGSIEALQLAAERAGLSDHIVVTGYLSDDDLRARLRECRAGLRLALRTDGEMSAAVTDLVALGLPTVTNLATMGRSSLGLTVIPDATDDQLIDALAPLLTDNERFDAARLDALGRADAWGFGDVAKGIIDWVEAQPR